MKAKILGLIALMLVLSMLFAGCTTPTTAPEATEAPEVTEAEQAPATTSIEGKKVCYLIPDCYFLPGSFMKG